MKVTEIDNATEIENQIEQQVHRNANYGYLCQVEESKAKPYSRTNVGEVK